MLNFFINDPAGRVILYLTIGCIAFGLAVLIEKKFEEENREK